MIDLRSDTVTLPTETMYASMASAELGDDGREGDPTVRHLEALAAERTGKQAGLFLASGTMANLVALLAHGERGADLVLEATSHLVVHEHRSVALAGLAPRLVPGRDGALDLDGLRRALAPGAVARPVAPAVVVVENTHNEASGAASSLEHLDAVSRLARDAGARLHLDGARLFNAAVAIGAPASAIAAPFDSVAFCLSKGLSAPVGSVLCGSEAFVERARSFRHAVGGTMRQAGVVAAAGVVALETMIDRLADDHARARTMADRLRALDIGLGIPERVDTNIVRIDVSGTGITASIWRELLAERDVRVNAYGDDQLRIVTHRHIDDTAVVMATAAFTTAFASAHSAGRKPTA
ncbi:MAG: GntG family PLP-dependent aldolase [Acidimicrobiia bacterium]